MMDLLGDLFEKDVAGLDLGPWYRSLGMQFIDLPLHPFIPKRMKELVFVNGNIEFGHYTAGPIAGYQRGGKNSPYMVEVSDKTCKQLTDHKMGGQEIAPGTFYVEMVLEASGLPCTLTNVEFKSMCKIPHTSKGAVATIVSVHFNKDNNTPQTVGEITSFTVQSLPNRARPEEIPSLVPSEHCTGYVIKTDFLDDRGHLDVYDLQPQAYGLLGGLQLKDIGPEGKDASSCLSRYLCVWD